MAKLYFYFAAMNAGKSTTLLQADFNYRERGMETMLWTASFDDRAGAGTIGSRIALNAPASTFDPGNDLDAGRKAPLDERGRDRRGLARRACRRQDDDGTPPWHRATSNSTE